jgi:hypothetical protein
LWFDQGCKWNRAYLHGLLSQSIEQFAARFGFAAVESKGELVQVIVQMLQSNSTLVGAQQPSFERIRQSNALCCWAAFSVALEL